MAMENNMTNLIANTAKVGVIVSGVTKEDAIDRYLGLFSDGTPKQYTSQSSDIGVISEAGTVLYHPVTANFDVVEQDIPVDFTSTSSSNGNAYYAVCSDGCGAHVISSDDSLNKFCPVCSSDLNNDPEDVDGNTIDDDLEDFDDSYSGSEATFFTSALTGFSSPDDAKQAIVDYPGIQFVQWHNSERDDLDVAGPIFSGSEEDLCQFLRESDKDRNILMGKNEKDFLNDGRNASQSSSDDMSDADFEMYAAMAGFSMSDDEDGDADSMEDSEGDVEDESDEFDDLGTDDIDSEFNVDDSAEEVDPVDLKKTDIVAVASNKDEAIMQYASMCLSGEFVENISEDTGNTFYSASSADQVLFDPRDGSFNIRSRLVSASTDTIDDDMVAHYCVCSSADCGSHIISSSSAISNCPVCASDVAEPEVELDDDDDIKDLESETETETSDPDSNLDFSVVDDSNDEEESESKCESSNKKTLEHVLSFVSGGQSVSSANLNVAYCGNVGGLKSWIAFYNGQPVAKATSVSAAKHANIFEEPAYANATIAGANELGVAEILDSMGFEASMSSVAMSDEFKKSILNAHFKDKMRAMAAQVEKEISDKNALFVEQFKAALATAAVGINRGFFKDHTNPVKSALASALAATGIRQPESILDGVYRQHSDNYHQRLFAKAEEIMEKPLDVQNELAKAVSESNYMESVSSDGLSDSNLESRLGVGTPTNVVDFQPTHTQQHAPKNTSTSASFNEADVKNIIFGLCKK